MPGSLVTVTSPPIMRASLRVMAKPSPVKGSVFTVRLPGGADTSAESADILKQRTALVPHSPAAGSAA
jgi:hypothetical protein